MLYLVINGKLPTSELGGFHSYVVMPLYPESHASY